MFETTQAATSGSSNYQALALTIVKLWVLYRTTFVIAFVVLLLTTIVFVFRKSSWGKWFLLSSILIGATIVTLDSFTLYVAALKKAAVKEILFAPFTKTVGGIGTVVKGIFGLGK